MATRRTKPRGRRERRPHEPLSGWESPSARKKKKIKVRVIVGRPIEVRRRRIKKRGG